MKYGNRIATAAPENAASRAYTLAVITVCLAAACAGEGISDVDTPEAPSGTNYALRFYGNRVGDVDRVKIRVDDPETVEAGLPVDVGATDFTIEFWMRAVASENTAGSVTCGPGAFSWISGIIIIDRDRKSLGRRSYGISMAGGVIVFGVAGDDSNRHTICGDQRVDDGAWHHVAATRARSTGALQLYVDGVLEASVASGPSGDLSYPDDGVPGCGLSCDSADPFIVIGAEKHDIDPQQFPSFSGWLDEIRFSTVIRYTGDFTPPTSRFRLTRPRRACITSTRAWAT